MKRDLGIIKYAAITVFLAAVFSVMLIPGIADADFTQGMDTFLQESASYEDKLSKVYAGAVEYKNPSINSFAYLRISPENAGNYSVAQACDLWDYANKNWIVISDPRGPEYISTATGTIKSGLRGDCDDYSVFLSSLIMSVGGRCRIATAQGKENSPGHAYPELFIGYDEKDAADACRYVHFRYGCDRVYYSFGSEGEKTAYWLNLDWTVNKVLSPAYYTYGNNTAELNMYHPGKTYYTSGQVTVYYADGTWAKISPGHGYYMQKYGMDTLNVL